MTDAWSAFILRRAQGMDITVFGDGDQTRSFCYVGDLIDAIMRFMGTKRISGR